MREIGEICRPKPDQKFFTSFLDPVRAQDWTAGTARPSISSDMTPACLTHGFTCSRIFLAQQDGVQQLWPLRLSLTRPHDDFNFEELLSDLTTIARIIRPHLGSSLVSTSRLTFGVHCCTLPHEELCGRRTNPVKSACKSSSRSARVPMRAFQRCRAGC